MTNPSTVKMSIAIRLFSLEFSARYTAILENYI